VHETDAFARAAGVVNTLWLEDGRLCGANTDTYGFMTYLGLKAPTWSRHDRPVSILGAGGAARAIVFGFVEAGVAEVRVFNRTREGAEALAAHFPGRVRVCEWERRSENSREASVLVNATSAGLRGQGSLAMDFSGFGPDCVVCDIVYVPLETALIRDAKAAGLATVDGLGMLLHQAVPGFARWFGVTPEVTPELRALLIADLGRV
jgi:shikimate dehydrogenase